MATQAEIDAAKLKMDNAFKAIAPTKASMDSWYNTITKCCYKDGNLVLGETSDVTCQKCFKCSDHPGCCSKETCESNMASYNASVTNWETANTNYENAKDDYDNLKGSQTDEEITQLEQDAGKVRTQYYVWGAIAIVALIIGVFVWLKYRKK